MYYCATRPKMAISLLGLFLALTGAGAAHQLTGSVEGTIRDTSGGVLPGTTVELKNVATGATLSQVTGSAGNYSFTSVKPGSYRVQASFKGFKAVSRPAEVDINKTVRIDFTLAVSALTEQVVVTGAPPAHDIAHAELSLSVDSKLFTDLPTLTHDITQLIELMPGVRMEQGGSVGGSQLVDLSGSFALGNGTRRGQSIFYVDGAENMGTWRNQGLQMPNPDAIQEVQVITSSAPAEFGKEPGVRMNTVIKSGTNSFHGTMSVASHFTGLNANTWSANSRGAPRPSDRQTWMGATLGGPILRNRTFFFASFQHFYDNDPSQLTDIRMPTAAMLAGDFTALPNFNIKAIDPATGKAMGKTIPSRLINPVAARMAMRFPVIPQYSNDPALGRFFWQFQRPAHDNMWIGKVDHQISAHQQLSGSYLTTDAGQVRPDNLSGAINNVPGWGGDTATAVRQHTFSLRHLWAATSVLVLENRAALARQEARRDRTATDEDIATLGGVWPGVTPNIDRTLPTLFLSGGPTARGGPVSEVVQQNFRVSNTSNWLKGKHNLKFGGEVQHSLYSRLVGYDNSQIRFTGAYANTGAPLNGPWPTLATPSGDNQFALAWADFLMGRARTFQATGAVDNSFHGLACFFFIQDQFKVTPRLTITPGLRYEWYGAQTSMTMLAGYVAGHKSDQFANAPVGLAFGGDRGIPAAMRNPDRNNLAPRLGLAWDVFGKGKMVARAGAGLYYAYPPLSIVEQLSALVDSPTLAGGNASLSNLWGTSHTNSGDTMLQYPGGMPSFDRDPAQRKWQPTDIMGYSPDATTPYQVQVNVGVERKLIQGLTIMAGYLGNRARKGWSVRDHNLALWQPGAGTGNVDARRQNQTWRGIDLISTDVNDSYDAAEFTATLSRRGLYGRVIYTLRQFLTSGANEGQEVGIDNSPTAWAHNPRNIRGDVASVVSRQQVRGIFNYQLPKFSSNAWIKQGLSGWQVSGNFSWYDGDRLNVILGPDYNFDGFAGDRPNLVGPIRYLRQKQGNAVLWIDRSTFANPPAPSADNPYPFGNLPRNAVRGPNRLYMGAAIMKNFLLGEKYRLQLRLDTSNLFNHPNLSRPVMDLSRSDFGLIRTKDGGGRVFQMHARFVF